MSGIKAVFRFLTFGAGRGKNFDMDNFVEIGNIRIGGMSDLLLIAGPCVIEDEEITLRIAAHLAGLTRDMGIPLVFKASYDKANRTSVQSFRGPGIERGLKILDRVKAETGLMILSDIHHPEEAAPAAEVLDILQIPALLCRQTDLLLAAARTGRPVNIKKGQFMAPWDMRNAAEKLTSGGCRHILLTERGTSFGYNNLVSDFRGIPILQESGWPVIFDATHSVQLPGGGGDRSAGERAFAPILARAAVGAGADGIFLEVHPDPDRALCDGPNSIPLEDLEGLLRQLQSIRKAVTQG